MYYSHLYWKLLIVASDLDFKLVTHVLDTYSVVKILIGPARIAKKISLRKRLVDESFIRVHQKYCLLIWLLIFQNLNDKIRLKIIPWKKCFLSHTI